MNTIIATENALLARHISKITQISGSSLIGVSKSFLIEEAKNQMRSGVCHFIYKKKNGEIREAFGTLTKPILNSTLVGTGMSPETWGCCYYHDCIKGSARSFRWENIIAVI